MHKEPTNVTTHNCSRCGGAHSELPIRRMRRPHAPPEAGGVEWTHWAACPETGDPIVIALTPQSSEQREVGVWFGGEGVRAEELGRGAPSVASPLGSLVVLPVHLSDGVALDHVRALFSGSPGLELRLTAPALAELVEFAVTTLGVPYPMRQEDVTALHDVLDNLHVLAEGDDVAPLREAIVRLVAGRPR